MTSRWMAAAAVLMMWGSGVAEARQAQETPAVETDPLRCWWRTDKGAVKMGEPFTAVLTCAALETASTTVVADRTRLDPAVMALPPFDVVSGTSAEDATTSSRRYFQYTYQLRLLNDTAFGQDLTLTGLTITYRIDTRTSDGGVSQGRDQTYNLPALGIRILSIVHGGSRDIRDSTSLTFADLDQRRFRARALGMFGWVAYALSGAVALLTLARLYRQFNAPKTATTSVVSGRAILASARRELSAVAGERQRTGWTDELAARAGAALRVVGGYALGRPASQSRGLAADRRPGQLSLSQGLLRRRHALVSASVTPGDLTTAAGTSGPLQLLHDGLLSLTASRYGKGTLDETALDSAVSAARGLASSLAFKHSWPIVQAARVVASVRGWIGRSQA